ncbi:hypothetical protein Tco_1475297 [Tanacetum coccineum]
MENKKEFKYHFGCRSMKLTHVCFAGDLLMFFHDDINSVNVLKEAIEDFEAYSSLIPNYTKSTIIFGSMNNTGKQNIIDKIPFKVDRLPVKYMGVHLTFKIIGVSNYKSLLDRIRNKTFNWKNKCLSHTGRLQLVASVLEYVHVYWASVTLTKNLFFQCKYFTQLWNKVKQKISLRCTEVEWSDIVNNITMEYNGNSINNIIRRLGLDASVFIMAEEEIRKRSIDELYEFFVETLRLRLSSLKAKLTKDVRKAQLNWNIKMDKKVECQ